MGTASGSTGSMHTVGGHTVHTRVDGPADAPPLVLVHGFLCSMRSYDRLVPLLSGDFRVIRTDLLGHGSSAKPDHGYSPEEQAALLDPLLDRLGVNDPTLVGHSLGADVAVALVERGRRVAGLVVLGEGPDYSLATVPRFNTLLRLPVIGGPLYRSLPAAAARRVLEGWLAPGRSLSSAFDDPAGAVRDLRAVPYPAFLATQRQKERYVADRPLDARLGALGTRTLAIFGTRDRVYRAAESCERYAAVAHASTELVPGTGHLALAENPTRIAEIIRGWIR